MNKLVSVINDHDIVLLKMDKYRTIWFIISGLIFSMIISLFMVYKFSGNIEHQLINDIVLFVFLLTSIIWWTWTMIILIQILKQQKLYILYRILSDISDVKQEILEYNSSYLIKNK